MPMNAIYRGPSDMPAVIPVFPLSGALLLPRGHMPLNIFEPRYLEMVDDALRDGHRMIELIQPDAARIGSEDRPNLYKVGCVGRMTQFAESGDGRYLSAVYRHRALSRRGRTGAVITAYRQCRVTFALFVDDFTAFARARIEVNRDAVLGALTEFQALRHLQADWDGIEKAPNEALVNALAMMAPFGAAEKQAMLEAH